MPRLALVHTAYPAIVAINRFYGQQAAELTLFNLLDDNVLRLFQQNENDAAESGLLAMLQRAVEVYQADAALVTCSCVSTEMAARLSDAVKVPVLKIDTAMAEAAVAVASRIGIVISNPPTLGPTSSLLQEFARKVGKHVDLLPEIVPAAYEALHRGDMATHDRMLEDAAQALLIRGAEAIVLAQVTMAPLDPVLSAKLPVPVFSSLKTSLQAVRNVFTA